MAPWAGPGTPSPPCPQITSSCLEVSPPKERRWVRLVLAVKTLSCWCDHWNQGWFVFCLSGDAWLYYVSKNEWKPFKHSHTGRPRQVPLKCQRYLCVCFRSRFRHMWHVCEYNALFVFQIVAHSVLRTWWRSVCVWRVRQQPVSSTESGERRPSLSGEQTLHQRKVLSEFWTSVSAHRRTATSYWSSTFSPSH